MKTTITQYFGLTRNAKVLASIVECGSWALVKYWPAMKAEYAEMLLGAGLACEIFRPARCQPQPESLRRDLSPGVTNRF
jgi:hypothetical protein